MQTFLSVRINLLLLDQIILVTLLQLCLGLPSLIRPQRIPPNSIEYEWLLFLLMQELGQRLLWLHIEQGFWSLALH